MSDDSLNHAGDEARRAKKSANSAADHSQKAFSEAVSAAERTLSDAARTAERVLREGVETLRSQTRAYTDNAGQHVDEAQRYVLARVKERPMTATLTGLGVGLLIGLLLSNRGK
ncbi:MAG TPA: hypothetical protein VFC47_03720 [Caulobacteraceae bacterium]|nr:hypothetical protein [Caulobacteraceae bacterium]